MTLGDKSLLLTEHVQLINADNEQKFRKIEKKTTAKFVKNVETDLEACETRCFIKFVKN